MSQIAPMPGLDLEGLPMDVFELVDSGLELESLTAGHGLPENGASDGPWIFTSGGTGCCCCGGINCMVITGEES